MTCLIELPQSIEEIAAVQAQSQGKSLEEYLPELLANALTQQVSSTDHGAVDRMARIQRFRQWAESNGHETPHLSDAEISRDAIYGEF